MTERPRLRVTIAEAEKAIQHCLNTGKNLRFANWNDAQRADIEKRATKWYQEVEAILKGLFTSSVIAEDFAEISHELDSSIAPNDKRYVRFEQPLIIEWHGYSV